LIFNFIEQYSNWQFGYCEAGLSSSATLYNGMPLFVVGAPGSINFLGTYTPTYTSI